VYSTDRGATLNGAYASGAGGAIDVQNSGTTLTISGQITGAGSLIKTGPGTLTLSNSSNNYSADTFIETGRLSIGIANAIPAGTDGIVSAGAEFTTGGLVEA